MPLYHRHYSPGELQFITSSVYHRTPIFANPLFCREFAHTLQELREEFGFLVIGWVLMPEHFHLLIKPEPAETTSEIVKQLKQRTGHSILQMLRSKVADLQPTGADLKVCASQPG